MFLCVSYHSRNANRYAVFKVRYHIGKHVTADGFELKRLGGDYMDDDFKVSINPDAVSLMQDAVHELVYQSGVDVKCPLCDKVFHVHTGENTCPHCNGNVTVDVGEAQQ